MSALLFALALLAAQDQAVAPSEVASPPVEAPPTESPAAAEPAAEARPEELPFPVGAPTDDYGLVSWCYGALSGYLGLHDRVLPEVTRIENAYRKPGVTLAQDMATYADMQEISRANMKLFARAMEAAERASLQPINTRGAAAVQKGRASWAGADALPTRTVAQQWMGWALPARCTPTAEALETRAKLMGTAFKANEPEAEPASPEAASALENAAAAPETSSSSAESPTPAPETTPPEPAPVESPPTHS